MALIVSGAEAQPSTSTKRKKRRQGPQRVFPIEQTANIANLHAAYYAVHGTYPSPEKAKTMLQLGGTGLRTVEDWKALVNPESLLPEVMGVPKVEQVQYEGAKREAEAVPFEPSGIRERGETRKPTMNVRGRYEAAHAALGEDDDIDPYLEFRGKVQTYATTGAPSEWSPAPAKQIGKIDDTIAYLRTAQAEARDLDLTPADRARHDVFVGNMSELARELAGRRTYLGLDNDFDPDDPYGKGIIAAYREYIGYSQLPAIVLNDGSEKGNARSAAALKVITDIYQLEPGEDPAEIVDAVTTLPETFIRTGVYDEAVLDLCYKSAMAGRPFGQSESKARWDYAFTYGRDKLSAEGEEKAAQEEQNINTMMGSLAKIMDPGGVVTGVMDRAETVFRAPFSAAAGVADLAGADPRASSTIMAVGNWFAEGAAHMDIVGLAERPLITAAQMFDVVLGQSVVKDGQVVSLGAKYGETPEGSKFDPGALFRAEAWQAAWDSGEGKMLVGELIRHLTEGLGVEEGDTLYPVLAESALWADYTLAIFLGAAVDTAAIPAVGAGFRALYRGARRAADPKLMAGLRAKAAEQRGSFTVGGKGDDLADVSVTEDGVSGQTALVPEGERITGDTQLGMGAIDQDVVAPGAKPKTAPEAQSGGLSDAEVAAAQAAREAEVLEANAAFDQLPVAKSADGVKVKRTSVGEVDSTIAADVELLNREGYKTFGSHGYAKDHPKAHPAKDIDPYVEFDKSDLVRSADDIKGERADIEAELEQLANEEMLRQADAEMLAKAEIDAPKTPDELMKWLRLERIDYGEAAEAFVDKTLGGDKLAPYRQFKGTLASKKQRSTIGSFDEVAAHVADHFPWFGINDSDALFAFISGYKKGTKLAGKATIAKRTKELMARLEALDKPSARANERFRAIASAAKKTGMKLEKSTADGRTLVAVMGKNLHDFVEALTGKPVDPGTVPIRELPKGLPAGSDATLLPGGTRAFRPVGGPQPPPPQRLVGLLEPPSKKGRVPWLLWNRAEVIAYAVRSPALIGKLFRVPDVSALKPFVLEMAAASDPDTVVAIAERLRAQGGIPQAFDLAMPGLYDLVRASGYTKGLKSGLFRIAGTPAGMEGRHVSARHADRTVVNMGWAFKMGKRKWTQADRDLALEFADRAFKADMGERMHIVDEFCQVIKENMEAEGTWAKYEKMVDSVRKSRAKQVAYEYRRAYTKGSRVVPVGTTSRLTARIKWYERKLADAVDDVDKKALQAGLDDAKRKMDDYAKAADIINGKAEPDLNMSLQTAHDLMDSLGYPTPFLVGELANTIRLPFDPRLMGWFHSGAPLRQLVRVDSARFDKLMRTWKMVVMGSLSFPFRVFGKDEGLRLISEGIIPLSPRWWRMAKMRRELLGGRSKLTGWRKLTKTESDELDDLLKIDEPDEAQLARMTELKGKTEGILSPDELLEVRGEGSMDWAQLLSDDFELIGPSDPRYFKSLPRNLRKLHEEPIMKEFLKTRLREPDEIRAWLQKLLASEGDGAGATVRMALAKMERITGKQATPKEIRTLLRSTDRTGAAGNLAAFVEDWVDILKTVGVDDRLRRAIKKPGSVPMSELRKIDPEKLWAIPTRDDIIFGRNLGGLLGSGTWNPMQLWYEGVTLRYMEGLSNRLREAMFADGYERVLKELVDLDIDPQVAHKIAFERGIDYCNSTTFTRNPSILEDMLRNYVPFINSYRQFWRYWGKMLARHPGAMNAAYQYNPDQAEWGLPMGQYTVFGLAMQAFWQEQPGGLTEVVKHNLPNVSPFVALLFSSLAERSGIRIEGLPGFKEDNSFNPLSSLKALAFGFGMEDTWGIEKLMGDMSGYEREHAYLLKEFAAGKGEPVGPSGTTETDWPFWVDFWNAFGEAHFDRPEFVMQGLTRIFSPAGSQKLTPARTSEIVNGMRHLSDPTALANYRAAHPDFDTLQCYYEAKTPEEKDRVAQRAPWVVDYAVTHNDWDDGVYTFTSADYISAREEGKLVVLEDDDIRRNIAAARMRHWGGYRPGDPQKYEGFMSRKEAEAAMEKALKYADDWKEAVIAAEAGDNAAYAKVLRAQWEEQQPDDRGDALPGIFHRRAMEEAKAKGVEWREYERTLSPVSIGQDFEVVYGSDYLLKGEDVREVDVQRIMRLLGARLGVPSQAKWWLRETDYPEAIEAAQKTLREEALSKVTDDSKEEYFDLDSRALRSMGVACGPGIDRAIADVRKYYYDVYQPVVDQYGAQSSEGRKARLAYNAYKDRRFSRVKGGEALTGGLGERLMHIPYFTKPNYASVASGHHAPKEQQRWQAYVKEASKMKPDMEKIEKFHRHFTPYDEDRYQEFMRVNHMMYAAAMASYLRQEMKESYSDYYGGPGNSVYSGAGQKMVSRLSGLIRDLIRMDKERFGASAFAKDVYDYFESPHRFAWTALEWYSH